MKNKRIAKGFDQLAPFYTKLSKFVFGITVAQAQFYFLDLITENDRILILGGGDGKFLESLLKKHPGVSINYIDISPRMIELARKNTFNPINVNFIVGTELTIPNQYYSIVITNFYLDLFTQETLMNVINLIQKRLEKQSLWLVTDFVAQKLWHKIMLWIMYRFFRITTRIEAKHLPNWRTQLSSAGLQEIDSKKFYGGFIQTSVYKNVRV